MVFTETISKRERYLIIQKTDAFCLQTQLATLHEKYEQEVLKAEKEETSNKENQKLTETLKSEFDDLKKKNEQLEKKI